MKKEITYFIAILVGLFSGIISYAYPNITFIVFLSSFLLIIVASHIAPFRHSKIGFLSFYTNPIKYLTTEISGFEREMMLLGFIAMVSIVLGVGIQIWLGLV